MSIRSLLLVAVAASGTACQALALPTSQPTPPPTHTMSAVVQVPVGADKAHVDAAQAVLAKRLKSLGITNFTVAVGPVMQFSLIVPDSVDPKAVEAVLHARGVVGWLPWPSDKPAPVAGDRASPGATPRLRIGAFSAAPVLAGAVSHAPVGAGPRTRCRFNSRGILQRAPVAKKRLALQPAAAL